MTWKIKKKVLETALVLSKRHYPNEFGALLTSDNQIINDIYIIPLTKDSKNSVSFRLDLVPMSLDIVGSIHSHPSGSGNPSLADLNFFSRRYINVIVFPPFDLLSYKAYDKKGKLLDLEVID